MRGDDVTEEPSADDVVQRPPATEPGPAAGPAREAGPPRRVLRWVLVALGAFALLAAALVWWALSPLGPTDTARAAFASGPAVKAATTPQGWLKFTPTPAPPGSASALPTAGPAVGLILYPGARIDPGSYAPAARDIAARGFLVVVVPMPLNIALLAPDSADEVVRVNRGIKAWVVGGHSLGGAMAARYAARRPAKVAGVVLWAAYPSSSADLSDTTLTCASIYGTNDGLVDGARIEASRARLPQATRWVAIEGGNHAQFGDYGPQPGDRDAVLGAEEQRERVVTATTDLLFEVEANTPGACTS